VGSGFRAALLGFGVLWLAFSQLCLALVFCQLSVGFGFRSALVGFAAGSVLTKRLQHSKVRCAFKRKGKPAGRFASDRRCSEALQPQIKTIACAVQL